ncbi:TPA: DotI/IcmL family type IV secretion protein [Salmonella enterica subsp. enterica serovar Typhimurium]
MSAENQSPPVQQPQEPDQAALMNTIRIMKQAEQRANLVPGLLKALLCTGTALLISLAGNGMQYVRSTNVEREYFATDNGRLVRLAPTSQPGWSQNDVMSFGSETLSMAFNLDFVHYRSQISALAPRFSDEGFAGYVNALQASNILDTIKKEKMNLTATIGVGVLIRQGQLNNGVWFWTFQYPVKMRLVGQTVSKPEQSFIFEMTIQRVDPRLKPSGMEIRQMISRNAGSN